MQEVAVLCPWLRLGVLLLLVSFVGGQARTVADTVLTNPDPVALANAVQQGGTVKLAFSGVVELQNAPTLTNDVTLDGSGFSPTLSAGGRSRLFTVATNTIAGFKGVVLANGLAITTNIDNTYGGGSAFGGAILNAGGHVELTDCQIVNCQAIGQIGGYAAPGGSGFGGAICSQGGFLSVVNSRLTDNSCTGGAGGGSGFVESGGGGFALGGAIYCANATVTLDSVAFTSNQTQGGDIGTALLPRYGGGATLGGAIAIDSSVATITNCVLEAIQSVAGQYVVYTPYYGHGISYGGALYCKSSTVGIDETLFTNNVAQGSVGRTHGGVTPVGGDGDGGAIFHQLGSLQIRNTAFVGNQAIGGPGGPDNTVAGNGFGGAICTFGSLKLVNCTLYENSAAEGPITPPGSRGGSYGGGIWVGGAASLVNSTFAGNVALTNGSGASIVVTNGIAVALTNMILTCSLNQTNVVGAVLDGGHNISSDASANFTSGSSRNNTDPLFGALGYYGGPTPTMPLLPNSPAIDAGDDAACPATDQRGVIRPQGVACDIGAFELAPTVTLTPAAQGKVSVLYHFKAGETNEVSNSGSLTNWQSIGTRVSDAEGTAELEQVDPAQLPTLFYKVVPR